MRILAGFYGDFPGFLRKATAEHGPIVRFRSTLFRRPDVYLINEPAAIEEVLVTKGSAFEKSRGARRLRQIVGTGLLTSDEPQHLAHRRLVQPAFHRRRLEEFARVMSRASTELVERWSDGESIDVDAEMNHLALEIVANALFGVDLSSADKETISRSLDVSMGMYLFWQTPLSELFDNWPLPNVLHFKAARARLWDVVTRIIRRNRSDAVDRGDLLSMLLSARDEDGRGGLSDDEIRDEALTILLAGHETTANALAWTFYLLQRHPGVESALQGHIDAVLGGRTVTFDDVPKLDYVRAVFAETMRLYPPAWVTSREAMKPVTIGGVDLAPGDMAIVSPYVTHRDPRVWPDAELFDPQRFLDDRPRERYAYFPFGGGSRMCIGDSFAWTEGVIALATIAQRARLERIGESAVEVRPLVTLRPRTPIAARVRLRHAAMPVPAPAAPLETG